MNKCLKITFNITLPLKKDFLPLVIQKLAQDHNVEGLAQLVEPNKVKVFVCGNKEDVDLFLDGLHKKAVKHAMTEIEAEPFLKEKDYRGVFRVIE